MRGTRSTIDLPPLGVAGLFGWGYLCVILFVILESFNVVHPFEVLGIDLSDFGAVTVGRASRRLILLSFLYFQMSALNCMRISVAWSFLIPLVGSGNRYL